MDTWDIKTLDPLDEVTVRRWWELGRDAQADRPYDFYWPWESARLTLAQTERRDSSLVLLGAFAGDEMLGSALVQLPLLDNLHLAFAEVAVPPVHRRRGIGTALLDAVTGVVRSQGRSTILVEAYTPPESSSPGLAFALATGFRPAVEEGVKVADLQASRRTWAPLAAEAAEHHQGFELRTFVGRLPADLVDGLCRLQEAFNEQAPLGDIDVEPEKWDEARVREREQRYLDTRRDLFMTLAVAPDGTVAALTEVITDQADPRRAYQSGTLVLPEHRGHRLGLAIKIANQQAVLDRFPACELMITGNAGVNEPMNAINDRLGFRVVERCVEVQKVLA